MVWLGVLHALTELGPAALIAGVAVAVLAFALTALAGRAAAPRRSATGPAAKAAHRSDVVTRFADPDAPGRSRPRAPSRVPAAR